MRFWDEIRMAVCERLVLIIIRLVPDCPEGTRLVVYLNGWAEETFKERYGKRL